MRKTPRMLWGDALDDAAMRREHGCAGIDSSFRLHDMFQDVDV
jgi:hypothetical protein